MANARYLERVEPEGAKTIYSILLANADSMNFPIEVMSFADFEETVFNRSLYFYWRDTDRPYALVNLSNLDATARQAEFGVISLKKRDGHAADACFALWDHVFNKMGLNRMFCIVNVDNEPCLNLIKKHHLRQEATLRESRFKGQFIDQRVFAILQKETKVWKRGSDKAKKG